MVRDTMSVEDKILKIRIGHENYTGIGLWRALRVVVPRVILAVYFGIVGSAAALSQPSDLETIVNWLSRLDKDIAGIQQRLVAGTQTNLDTTGGWSPAIHETRLSELEEQLRVLTGHIEEARHELAQTTKLLSALASDVQHRMGVIEEKMLSVQESGLKDADAEPSVDDLHAGSGSQEETLMETAQTITVEKDPNLEVYQSMEVLGEITSAEQAEIAVVQPEQEDPNRQEIDASMPAISAEESYSLAYGLLLKKRDYVGAEQALRAFIQDYPEHRLAGNAYYWLGETFYVRNNYEGAAKAFAKGYKNFPEGDKAPDNLLKLGLSFRGMGQDDSACHVFRKLAENYPDAPAVFVTRVEQERAEAACS